MDKVSPILQKYRTWLIIAAVGVVLLIIYLLAFLNTSPRILMLGGAGSVLFLIFLPVVTAYIATTDALRERKTSKQMPPIRAQLIGNLQRFSIPLAIAAMICIPIAVIFYVYFQLYANAVFCGIIDCSGTTTTAFLPGTVLQQAPLALLVALGLWGVNLLGFVAVAGLVLLRQDFVETFFGTLVVLVATVLVMYGLVYTSKFTQVLLMLIAAVLPYLLTVGILAIPIRQPEPVTRKRR